MYARYTLNLKSVLDNSEAYEQLQKAMSTYPIYTKQSKEEFIPSYIPTRSELNNKIIRYYKYHEIGFETFGRFLDELETTLNEIMPYYNQLFFSADQDFNIIFNVDYKKTIDTTRDSESNSTADNTLTASASSQGSDTSTGTSTANDNTKNVSSQTPQSELGITAENIDSVDYADNVTWNKHNNNSTTNTTGSTTSTSESTSTGTSTTDTTGKMNEGIVETTKGNFGVVSAQDLVLKYRETILNIEQMIITDPRLKELFMLIY